jgi:hypothetical protein
VERDSAGQLGVVAAAARQERIRRARVELRSSSHRGAVAALGSEDAVLVPVVQVPALGHPECGRALAAGVSRDDRVRIRTFLVDQLAVDRTDGVPHQDEVRCAGELRGD